MPKPTASNISISGYVTCNGAYVEYNGQSVYKAIIPSEAIKATMKFCEENNFNYYFESTDYIYVRDSSDKKHIKFCETWGMKPETVIDKFDPDEIETYNIPKLHSIRVPSISKNNNLLIKYLRLYIVTQVKYI